MLKPALKSLLVAAALGASPGLIFAQDAPDTAWPQQGDEQTGAESVRILRGQTVSGTVVLLESFMRDGPQAARGGSSVASEEGKPKALLADDGKVYILLDQPADVGRSARADQPGAAATREAAQDADAAARDADAAARDAARASDEAEGAAATTREAARDADAAADRASDAAERASDEAIEAADATAQRPTPSPSRSAYGSAAAAPSARMDSAEWGDDGQSRRRWVPHDHRNARAPIYTEQRRAAEEEIARSSSMAQASRPSEPAGSVSGSRQGAAPSPRPTTTGGAAAQSQRPAPAPSPQTQATATQPQQRQPQPQAAAPDQQQTDADNQVYGMARPEQTQLDSLEVGDKLTLTGDVYERGGVRVLVIE